MLMLMHGTTATTVIRYSRTTELIVETNIWKNFEECIFHIDFVKQPNQVKISGTLSLKKELNRIVIFD